MRIVWRLEIFEIFLYNKGCLGAFTEKKKRIGYTEATSNDRIIRWLVKVWGNF